MVRVIVLIFILLSCMQTNAQSDTLNCVKTFEYYDTLLGDNLIVIWDVPPYIKKCSQKSIDSLKDVVKDIGIKTVIVDMIIDPSGNPICFRFSQELKAEVKTMLTVKLKQLRFSPALQNGKEVESIYTLKI